MINRILMVAALIGSPLYAAASMTGTPQIGQILQAAILFNPDLATSLGPIATQLFPISIFASVISSLFPPTAPILTGVSFTIFL